MLNANVLHKIVSKLESEKAKVQHNLKLILSDGLTLSPDDFPDEVDLATSELNQAMILRLKDRDQVKLNRINDALMRIKNQTYGICIDCDESIETKRLEVTPFTTQCIQCKEQEERAQKVFV